MKIYKKKFSRSEYINEQIKRSESKFNFCKVSYEDVYGWFKILKNKKINKICCLGTRNGREIDLFRLIFGNFIINILIKLTEVRQNGFNNSFSFLLNYRRSDLQKSQLGLEVFGVEINPLAARKDTLIASFDKLPETWNNKFDLIYSNSFDQSLDPKKTANQWCKILKNNGYLIFSFSHDKEPTESDPVGGLKLADILELFKGELVYYNQFGSIYSDLIIKIEK